MRRAAAGGGARAGAPPGGALGPDPGRGGRGAGSAGPRPLPAQSAARAPGQGGVAAPQAPSPALDLAPDTFVMRVLLEDTGETFQVANCRGDMTVRELKEELDLLVGIPLDLQRLQYLDQGGPCPPPSLALYCLQPERRPLLNPQPPGEIPHPQVSQQSPPHPLELPNPGHTRLT
ncbi:Ankyrin repeat domain-containing protein 60 [Vulpes lagopus]